MNRYDVMVTYAPAYYRESRVYQAILASEGAELDLLRNNIVDLKDQFFVDTATWGLDLWEKEYGLEVDKTLTYEERRSRIKGKMRGVGKVGSDLIRSVAEAYVNGEVSVTFDGIIRIAFIGIRGIPSALPELEKQLNDIAPAHLPVEFVFTYTTWDEVRQINWDGVKMGTWDELMTRRVI